MSRRARNLHALMAIVLVVVLLSTPVPARAASVTVNTTSDVNDGITSSIANLIANPGPDGVISLREAILAANNTAGADTIQFNIPYSDPNYDSSKGVWTIRPATVLPPLMGGGTSINGYSQPGALQATIDTPATIKIKLDGSLITLQNGLNIASASNQISGLSIVHFPGNGIFLYNYDSKIAELNMITGNYIGVDPDGVTANGNDFNGVFIGYGARFNTIGGSSAADRNIISANGVNGNLEGIGIHGADTQGNLVKGNYIGTDATGTVAIRNWLDGVRIYGGAHTNVIGPGNLISGNDRDGVRIAGLGSDQNQVFGNWIGLNQYGSASLYNHENGVCITDSAQENTVGGATTAQRNIISGNDNAGVLLSETGTSNNIVSGNFIGVTPDGATALPNDYGVLIQQAATLNTIGGDDASERNVISGNLYDGVLLENSGTLTNTITGNLIGLNPAGDSILSNGSDGIEIKNLASHNIIGPGNVVSGNASNGILIKDNNTSNNQVVGNYIGTDLTGMLALGNTMRGIHLTAPNNLIGGDELADRNVIAGNGGAGILVLSTDAHHNTIRNNYIGVTADGGSPLANDGDGISITSGAHHNTIGGGGDGQGNLISANAENGVYLHGAGSSNNTLSGNFIGTGPGGFGDLGNQEKGIYLVSGAANNQVGPRNQIAYNGSIGVYIRSTETVGVVVTESSIHDQPSAINLDFGNNDLPTPTVSSTTPTGDRVTISGTACPGCTVEVFCNPTNQKWTTEFVGAATADGSGNYSLTVHFFIYPYLTATATDATDGTSQVSDAYRATFLGIIPVFLPQVMR